MANTGRSQRPDRKGFEKLMYEQHVERIKTMKASVDNNPPRPHPLGNKGEIDKRRKFAAIEYDNRLLLERLAKIVQKKTIDNEVHDFIKQQKVFKEKLSNTKKKIEAQRITQENRRLLQRIQEVPPAYNHSEWEAEAKVREHTLKNMLQYPEFYEKRIEEKNTKKSETLRNYSSDVRGSTASYLSDDRIRNLGSSSSQVGRSFDFESYRSSSSTMNNRQGLQTAPTTSHGSSSSGLGLPLDSYSMEY